MFHISIYILTFLPKYTYVLVCFYLRTTKIKWHFSFAIFEFMCIHIPARAKIMQRGKNAHYCHPVSCQFFPHFIREWGGFVLLVFFSFERDLWYSHGKKPLRPLKSQFWPCPSFPGPGFGIYAVVHLLLPVMSLWLRRSHKDHSYWDVASANFKHAIGLSCELVVEHIQSFLHSGSYRARALVGIASPAASLSQRKGKPGAHAFAEDRTPNSCA